MPKFVFMALVASLLLSALPSRAQSAPDWREVQELTPFQARLISLPEKAPPRKELRIQLSEELARFPLLEGELMDLLGAHPYPLQFSTRSEEHSIRFSIEIPENSVPAGLLILTLRSPDGAIERSVRVQRIQESFRP